MKIAITGSRGFIGSAFQRFLISCTEYSLVEITRDDFGDKTVLAEKLCPCDAIIHFAGESRGPDGVALYRTNIELVQLIIDALKSSGNSKCHVFFASTTHIKKESPYHQSKRDGADLLKNFHSCCGNPVTIWYIPNTFGALMRPDFNSVIPTFAMLAAHGEKPNILNDVDLPLITLPRLLSCLYKGLKRNNDGYNEEFIKEEFGIALPVLWKKLTIFKSAFANGQIPRLTNALDVELWNTFYYFALTLTENGI